MSLFKNILKPFIEFNDQDESEPGLKSNKPEAKTARREKAQRSQDSEYTEAEDATAVPEATHKSVQPGTQKQAALNDYHNYFENLIEEANEKNPLFQGTDFKEFIDSKIDVEAIADEATRYKTAFNVLKRTGLTKERLVTTGQEYIKLIDQDLKGFADAYNLQYKADVEQREQLLQKKAEELQSLNDRISALNQEMKQLSQQITQNKEKLNGNKNAFISAGQEKKNEIEGELE